MFKTESMRLNQLLLLFLTIPACLLAKEVSVKLPEKEQFHLYLLAGQSNMAGRGIMDEESQVAHPRILALNKSGEWVPAVAPIHFDKTVAGVGLGKSFAVALAEANPEVTIGLIPAACGGSPISTWEPGGYHTQTQSHPYDDALARARHAQKVGHLKGILWHQGESDCRPGRAELYESKLRELVFRFRHDLGISDLPMVIGQLSKFANKPWSPEKTMVDAAHRSVANTLPSIAFVDSEGLSPNEDQVHFDTRSLRLFGERYAEAYLKLVQD